MQLNFLDGTMTGVFWYGTEVGSCGTQFMAPYTLESGRYIIYDHFHIAQPNNYIYNRPPAMHGMELMAV